MTAQVAVVPERPLEVAGYGVQVPASSSSSPISKTLVWFSETPTRNPADILEYVLGGGNVLSIIPENGYPILHYFIRIANVEVVMALMQSPNIIDFDTKDKDGHAPLDLIVKDPLQSSMPTRLVAVELLSAMIERLRTHPTDKISWGLKDENGHTFISRVANSQMLSVCWPVLKQLPFFQDKSRHPIVLTYYTYRSDWVNLTKEDKAFFLPLRGLKG